MLSEGMRTALLHIHGKGFTIIEQISPQTCRREALLRIAFVIFTLSFLLIVAGCGGKEEPGPAAGAPAEPVKVRAPENDPLLQPRGSIMAQGTDQKNLNKIAVVVNGEMITMHDLRMFTMAELARRGVKPGDPKMAEVERDVLDNMINDILMRQEAKRYQLSVDDSEIQAEIERTAQQNGMTMQQFEARLKTEGVTMQTYRKRMGDNMLRQRMASVMVARKVFVTEEEIASYYANNKAKMTTGESIDFSLLLIPEGANIQDIYARIKQGTLSFEDAAKQYSADKSARDGGRITGVAWDRMLPEMKKLLNSLKDGQMTPIMRTRGGYVVIRRDAFHPSKELSFAEARPRIEDTLKAPLLEERFKEYTAQLRSKAVIDIRF